MKVSGRSYRLGRSAKPSAHAAVEARFGAAPPRKVTCARLKVTSLVSVNEPRPHVAAVQAVLDQLEDQLAPHWIAAADELLRNDEPNEALIQIAWGIAADRLEVPSHTVLGSGKPWAINGTFPPT